MQSLLDTLEKRFNQLLSFMAGLVAVSIGLIAVLVPLNLFLLKFHLGSLWWLYGSIEYVLFFGVFASAPWVLQQNGHVRVEVIRSSLTPSAAAKLEVIVNLLGAAICMTLCIYGIRSGLLEFIDMAIPDKDVRVANWILVAFFAFSFSLCTTEFLLRLRTQRILKLKAPEHGAEAGL